MTHLKNWLFALIAAPASLAVTASAQVSAPDAQLPAPTADLRYIIDARASSVTAKVSFFAFSSKTARFPKMAGDVKIVPGQPEAATINVTFDATALEAPDETTLKRLRGEKFFWVAKYPQVRFVGKALKLTSDRKGKLIGQLTARGVTKPATLEIEFSTPPLSAREGQPISFTGKTEIDRRDFGMDSYQLIVGNTVEITLNAKMKPS